MHFTALPRSDTESAESYDKEARSTEPGWRQFVLQTDFGALKAPLRNKKNVLFKEEDIEMRR